MGAYRFPLAHWRPHVLTVLFSLRKPQLHGGFRTPRLTSRCPDPCPPSRHNPTRPGVLENYIRWLDASFGTPPHASRSPHRSILISGLAARSPLPLSQLELRAMPNPNQHPFVAETGRPSNPRRKSRLACNVCRARKTGCDGRKPVCTACSLKGWADKCGYPDSVMQPSAALSVLPPSSPRLLAIG